MILAGGALTVTSFPLQQKEPSSFTSNITDGLNREDG